LSYLITVQCKKKMATLIVMHDTTFSDHTAVHELKMVRLCNFIKRNYICIMDD